MKIVKILTLKPCFHWLLLIGLISTVNAMDGFSITNIQNFKSYKYGYTEGTLVKYQIKDNYVVKVDTLVKNACSPSINMSGTFFAYLTSTTTQKKIVIRNVDGGPAIEIPIRKTAWWLWWTADGSFYYTDTENGYQWYIRKVTLTKANGTVVVSDKKYGIFQNAVQGGFIDMSMIGERIIYRGEGLRWPCTSKTDSIPYGAGGCQNEKGSAGSIMNGDTTKPMSLVISVMGCGYGVSPSGKIYQYWPGAHNGNNFIPWKASEYTDPDLTLATHILLNSTWAVYRTTDPESKLESLTESGWVKSPIGTLGLDNGFACNSDHWGLSEITMANAEGRVANQIAINWKQRKAINITKIMPPEATPTDGDGGQFRGITFTGKSAWAERGDLWCSTQEDVLPELWQYVANRADDSKKWSDLLGIPGPNLSNGVIFKKTSQNSNKVLAHYSKNRLITLLDNDSHEIQLFSIKGEKLFSVNTKKHLEIPSKIKSGLYMLCIDGLSQGFIKTL